ncbi:hypothetical protein GINT2_002137 [Glugoides intestinalis]
MSFLNNWDELKIIHKCNILHFDFLYEHDYIKEITEDYYFLVGSLSDVEKAFYDNLNAALANELDLQDPQKEINEFIKKLNRYNNAKDAAQSLIGKIAELKSTTIKEINEELLTELDD